MTKMLDTYDMLGTLLQEGDLILYAKGAQSDDSFYKGTVVGFENTPHLGVMVEFKTHDSNRNLKRKIKDTVSIEPIKKANPEEFI